MGRKKESPFLWADAKSKNESFAPFHLSQIQSPAYQALSDSAKALLIICKSARRFNTADNGKNAPNDDVMCFYLNRALLKQYGWNNPNKARAAMINLVEHGFVIVIQNGANTRTKNIYRFSDKWKQLKAGETVELSGASKAYCTHH